MIDYVEITGPVSVVITDAGRMVLAGRISACHAVTIGMSDQTAVRFYLTTAELAMFGTAIDERLRTTQQPLVERMEPI